MHVELRARLADAVVEILDAGDLGNPGLDATSVALEAVEIRPIELDLDRTRGAGKVVDHIREDLHKLNAQSWHGGLDFHPHVVDYVEDGARPPAGWRESRDDVAGVLLGGEKSKLGAGAS